MNEQDARDPVTGFVDKQARVRVMETLDDMRDIRGYQACHHSDVPEYFPVSDEGFERQYAFKMSKGGRMAIDLVVEEPSYLRIVFEERNKLNLAEVIVKEKEHESKPLAKSTSDK